MAVDYNELSSKQDNYDGREGQLTANEWNEFVKSVKSHEDSIRSLSSAKIEGVRFNGQAYTDIVTVQAANGKSYRCIDVPADSSARTVKFNWLGDNDEPTNITVAANTSIPLKYQMYDVDINSNPFIGKGIVNVYVDDNKVYTIVNIGH
jgi:outer membrane lipoprotein-sorting protein